MDEHQETARNAAYRLFKKQLPGYKLTSLQVYRDLGGNELYCKPRFDHPTDGKQTRFMHRCGTQYVGVKPKLVGPCPLYRQEDLAARPGEIVFVVEGEKCVDALRALGLLAVTAGSAQDVANADWSVLQGRACRLWPDLDETGMFCMAAVRDKLEALGCTVNVIYSLALGLPPKGDIVDWLEQHTGATAEDILALPCALPRVGGDAVAAFAKLVDANYTFANAPTAPTADGPWTTTLVAPDKSAEQTFDIALRNGRITITGRVSIVRQSDGAPIVDLPGPVTISLGEGEFVYDPKSGVWWHETKTDKQGKTKDIAKHVCGPLKVLAYTRNKDENAWGLKLEWVDHNGGRHKQTFPMRMLHADNGALVNELSEGGLKIEPVGRGQSRLPSYLAHFPSPGFERSVDRVGWYEQDGAWYFILPDRTLGPVDAGEPICFSGRPTAAPALAVSGTTADWKRDVAGPAKGNTRLVFVISAQFSAALFGPAGEPSGGFFFKGKAGKGKTTALRMAASVFGHPDKYVRSCRATDNALENLASNHSGFLLALDEIDQAPKKLLGDIIYMLGDGNGKARQKSDSSERDRFSWRTLFFFTGETALDAIMSSAGRGSNAGHEQRLSEISTDMSDKNGIVEQLNGFASSGELIGSVLNACERYHGAVGIEWLELVAKHRANLEIEIKNNVARFVEEVAAGKGSQHRRVAKRFGLVAVGGEVATHLGLTGWPAGEAWAAAKSCFESWMGLYGVDSDREEQTDIDHIRSFLVLNESRFESVSGEPTRTINGKLGYIKRGSVGPVEFLVEKGLFRKEVCKGIDHKRATSALLKRELLQRDSDGGPTPSIYIAAIEKNERVYVIDAKILEG